MQGAHLSPCRGVVIGLSCLCHVQQVLSPCSLGPRLSDPTLPCRGSLSPRPRVWLVPCSRDNPHLLHKGDRVLWHRAWGWGHQKWSTIQPYNQGDFPKLYVHICYWLSKQKKPSKHLVLAEKPTGRHPGFICMPNYPAHQLSCVLVHPHRRDVHTSPCDSSAHRDRAVSGFLWWVSFTSPGMRSKPCRHKSMMGPGKSPASFCLSPQHAASCPVF